jgi:hypothetical protein
VAAQSAGAKALFFIGGARADVRLYNLCLFLRNML